MNVFYKTKLWWKHEAQFYHKDLSTGIKNLAYYFKTIWKDRDYDHSYIEKLLLKKYKRQYARTTKLNRFESSEKTAQALRILIFILERRKNGWYTDSWHSKYAYKEKHYFQEIFPTDPIYGVVDDIKKEKMYEMKSEGLTAQEETENIRLLRQYEEVEKRDWNIFCDITKKYHNQFWD